MLTIPAKRLMDFTPHDFNNRLKSSITVVYDDNVEVSHTSRELTINRYIFSILELFPNMDIVSKYSIHNYYVADYYVANTINRSMEAILEDIVTNYVNVHHDRSILEPVYEQMYLILEAIYNDVIYNHLEYVSSLCIRDFLDIQMVPRLLGAIDQVRVKKDLESVTNTYDVLDEVIRNEPGLKNNPIAKGYISGTISADQIKQLLGSRGFVTEIDGTIFKYPIASSFVLGLDNIYEIAAESRSGAKALYLSNRAISLSEYFAREMQLTVMGVESLVDGDCGNKEYIEWTVTQDDFKNIIGKHYFSGSIERVITKESLEIIGTTINIRTSLRCKLTNKRHICTACFGELSNNIPLHSNLGHISITTPSGDISQKILSTKHITTSATSGSIACVGNMQDYFIVKNNDPRGIYAFRANGISRKRSIYKLHIPQDQGFGIKDITPSTDVRKLNLSRITKLTNIYLSIEDTGKVNMIPLEIGAPSRPGFLSADFLEHIKIQGYDLDDSDRFSIDLSGWKAGIPVIGLPQIEFSYIELAKAIKNDFKGMRTDVGTPEAFLHRTFDLINSKLNINLALIEVIVYGSLAKDITNGDFDMGRNSETASPTKMMNIITKRSCGGSYAWEYVKATLLSPSSYYGNNLIDHPLDIMLDPEATMRDHCGQP